jgi:hypothetical protein
MFWAVVFIMVALVISGGSEEQVEQRDGFEKLAKSRAGGIHSTHEARGYHLIHAT